ncbi:MAG: DUF1476 domain-containing protein [Hyphomicrobiales bacterium]|nr:DUF1476 domain-containing protein [Hyphomicrobiales bacterium]
MRHVRKSGDHHERLHVQDSELEFKIMARRNRLVGEWAAEKLGLSGDEAQAYAKEVVKADFEEPGEEDVVRKIMADFKAQNISVSDSELRQEMLKRLGTARRQLTPE